MRMPGFGLVTGSTPKILIGQRRRGTRTGMTRGGCIGRGIAIRERHRRGAITIRITVGIIGIAIRSGFGIATTTTPILDTTFRGRRGTALHGTQRIGDRPKIMALFREFRQLR